ncbi:O-antigen ligase family protein [Vibrio cholerae]|nr:O-antigen ligase family protein [Vibrio cholerae]
MSIKRTLLWYLFIILPLFDMLNGYLVVNGAIDEGGVASPSQLARIVAVILLLITMYVDKINITIPILISSYILLVETFSGLFHHSVFGAIIGLTNAYKIVYLILLMFCLKNIINNRSDLEYMASMMGANLYIISCSIVFALITGLGNSTYGWGGGTKGFFASGNSLGIYLGAMSIAYLSLYKFNIISNRAFLFFPIVIFSILMLTSKAAIISSMLVAIYWVSFTKYRLPFYFLIFIVISFYLDDILIRLLSLFEVIISRFENSDSVFSFIASGRNEFVSSAIDVFFSQEPNYFRVLFGAGSFISYQIPNLNISYDTLETDLFDVIFMYGLFGCCLYLLFFSFYIYRLVMFLPLLVGFILIFGHSLVAGHVLFNGMSAIVITVYIVLSHSLKEVRNV